VPVAPGRRAFGQKNGQLRALAGADISAIHIGVGPFLATTDSPPAELAALTKGEWEAAGSTVSMQNARPTAQA